MAKIERVGEWSVPAPPEAVKNTLEDFFRRRGMYTVSKGGNVVAGREGSTILTRLLCRGYMIARHLPKEIGVRLQPEDEGTRVRVVLRDLLGFLRLDWSTRMSYEKVFATEMEALRSLLHS